MSLTCKICKTPVKDKKMTEHFQVCHPEYDFTRIKDTKRGKGCSRYVCDICPTQCSGFTQLIQHYACKHPKLQKPNNGHPTSHVDFSFESVFNLVSQQMERIKQLELELANKKQVHNDILKSGEKLAVLLQNAQEQLTRRTG